MVRGLGLCVGLLLVAAALMRRARQREGILGARRLEVLERVMVAPKTALVLARVDGRTVLCAVGADRVSLPYIGSLLVVGDSSMPSASR